MYRIKSFDVSYYPGCSMATTAQESNLSLLEMFNKIGFNLIELEDWNCCGATAYFHVDELLAYTLVARNLALAEKDGLDFVAPCSGCYKNAYFANQLIGLQVLDGPSGSPGVQGLEADFSSPTSAAAKHSRKRSRCR